MNKTFGDVMSVDKYLLHNSGCEGVFVIRGRSKNKIMLLDLNGQIINLVAAPYGCGPNFIQVRSLPPEDVPLPEDGWVFEKGVLTVPDVIQLNLNSAQKFDSNAYIALKNFPGHMKNVIGRRLRQPDCAFLGELKEPLKNLSLSIKEHRLENVDLPVIDVTGHGNRSFPAGDAALCGMLLTARCFALGGRFKEVWAQRLTIEVRRFLHRASNIGRNWLEYAISGRMTELQQKFFKEMIRDIENIDESFVQIVSEDELINGRAFLAGVEVTLELIKNGFFNS
ncbi:MAG: hypothetical protein PHF29_10540 [Candidatus Riflebacteria bacterium]|nr:hypothetical protein [Candidatus Riflebacteria bacterium]